jgi:NADPH:quinone reductase-like Zn-dependent oxidoreductase
MKAVTVHAPCDPDGVLYEDVPTPEAGAGEVLIRVCAAGVNPADWQVMRRPPPRGRRPWIPGYDVSGVVERTGPGVEAFDEGDAVFGMLFPEPGGAFAEFAVAKTTQVVRKPESISHVEAAALPVVALTAWQALYDVAQVSAGQRVVIHAAAGGVGHVAVQLAKRRDAYVIGTASTANHEFVRALGVDEPVDYRTTRLEDVVEDVDCVLDPFGGEMASRSLALLSSAGILVSLKDGGIERRAAAMGVRAAYVLAECDSSRLRAVAAAAASGELKPEVCSVLPLSDARLALETSKGGHARGKIVLGISEYA